jgi:hypothetical protein
MGSSTVAGLEVGRWRITACVSASQSVERWDGRCRDETGVEGQAKGVTDLLVAAVARAVGSLLNRYSDLPASPVLTAGMQMLVGGAILVALGLALGEAGRFDLGSVSWQSVGAVLYLVAVALVALTAYDWLLTATSPALVGTYAFVNPVVAVLLGWAAAGEAKSLRVRARKNEADPRSAHMGCLRLGPTASEPHSLLFNVLLQPSRDGRSNRKPDRRCG